jgi:hypothetical protein
VQADVTVPSTGTQSAGLTARYAGIGDSNMYLGTLTGSSGVFTAAIFRNLNGVWTQLSAVNVASGTGTLRFEVVGNSLKLFWNGTLVAYANDSSLATGTVGMRAYNGVGYGNFTTSVVTPLTPSLPFSDNFSTLTTGSQLARSWLARAGAFTGNASGQMVSANQPANVAVLNAISQANVRVQADIVVAASGISSAGLATRYSGTGDDNMYLGTVTGSNGVFTANIFRNVGGVWTLLASSSIASGTGTLRFESIGSTHRLYWNNVLIASATDSMLATGTVGLRSYMSVAYDNFSMAAL